MESPKNVITIIGTSKNTNTTKNLATEVVVKRLKDGNYLTIPRRDLETTLKHGFEFISDAVDTNKEMEELFGEKKQEFEIIKPKRGRPKKNV